MPRKSMKLDNKLIRVGLDLLAREGVRAARLALSGVRDEQEQGRRTVWDVLNAERELRDARVMRTQAGHARVAAYFAVLSGMGRLTPEALSLSSDKANGDKR